MGMKANIQNKAHKPNKAYKPPRAKTRGILLRTVTASPRQDAGYSLSCNKDYSVRRAKAFTFVEILLYIGLVSIFIVTLSSFMGFFNQAQLKSSTIEDVNQQGLYLNEVISQAIRDSDGIATPARGTNASLVTLSTSKSPARNPIKIELISGKVYMSEGVGTAVQITSDRVIVTNLNFINASQLTTSGNVHFQISINHKNPNNRSEFNYAQNFYGSATTR